MNNEKEIAEIKIILQNAIDKSAKYFQEELKKAFENGKKHLSRNECEKSFYDFQAEALIEKGYGNVKQAVKEFAEKLKEESQTIVIYRGHEVRVVYNSDIEKLIKEIYGE